MGNIKSYIIGLLISLPGVVLALTVHEFSHAFVSTKLGDPLPKAGGRVSLNPIHHVDPIGFLMLLLVGFGWAKPVYVDPRYYKNKKVGMSLVALAGPLSNFLSAFILMFFFLAADIGYAVNGGTVLGIVSMLLQAAVMINIGLGIFNLFPISPLDGSKVLAAALPLKAYEKVLKYERYGFILLIMLLFNLPGRLMGFFGVSYNVSKYFDLTFYLSYLRGQIIELYSMVWIPLMRVLFSSVTIIG